MVLLANDPMTQLGFSLYENKGVFAVLLGSGLSRAADIPTGWEITIDLIRRIALAQGMDEQPDWPAWYRERTGREPEYSALVEDIATSPAERRAVLHSYIEPTGEDREQGRKIPTAAHNAIAELVRDGYIRLIITTNFDRLMENALRERGIEPTVVASVDSLNGAQPLTHSACYILKLHGDYLDARILNTEAELSGYPTQYDVLLDRILDEHGLVVCGWSGDWDDALRGAFLRAPNRRYSTYWALRGELGSRAQELVNHRAARVVPVTDADAFFSKLLQCVQTLEYSHRQNPLSVEMLVASAKRLLFKPEFRIQLDELIAEETDRLIAKIDDPKFAECFQYDQAVVCERVVNYESATEALAKMAGVLGRWGDDSEQPLVLDVIGSLCAHAEKVGSGLPALLGLRFYPAVLVFTAYGLGLTRAQRWSALHSLFASPVERRSEAPTRVIETLFLWAWSGGSNSTWQLIDGLEQRMTPLSDHLFALFSDWRQSFAGLTPDFELVFDRFELLGSMAHFERNERDFVAQLTPQKVQKVFMPVGRAVWHEQKADKLVAEIQTNLSDALLKAGFAKGDPEYLDLFVRNFHAYADRASWGRW